MVCLETTFLIDLLKGKPEILELKNEIDKSESSIAVAAPSIVEIWAGASQANLPKKEKAKINSVLSSIAVLPLDEKSAKEAGEIEANLLEQGITIETEDIMIAGISITNGEEILTRDQHYAKIPGLKVRKY